MFAGKKSAQIREILISESAWEEMTCLFAPSLMDALYEDDSHVWDCRITKIWGEKGQIIIGESL